MAHEGRNILITELIFGGAGDAFEGTIVRGISTLGAEFIEVVSDDPKSDDGANAKIIWPEQPGRAPVYTEDTVATLVAKANGNVNASA